MQRHVTIKDIANALNISKSTVSRALADRFDVNPETRKAVLEMAEKLHYKPNPSALSLLSRRTKTIGIVVPGFTGSFFPRIIAEIQNVTEEYGFRVLITQSNGSSEVERRNLRMLEDNMVEGIILSMTHQDDNVDYYRHLLDTGIPLVFFNRVCEAVPASRVCIDDCRMSYLAFEHLIAQGYRRVLYFRGPEQIYNTEPRYRGYREALRDHGIPFDERLVCNCRDITLEEGVRLTEESLAAGIGFDAVYAFGDPLAFGVLRALKAYGIRIPDQVGVMGFTESTTAPLLSPSLTSVAQPLEQMGRLAAELLLEKIENPAKPDRTEILDARINVRESTDRKR